MEQYEFTATYRGLLHIITMPKEYSQIQNVRIFEKHFRAIFCISVIKQKVEECY
jgi:hypothetical protein